MNIELLRLNRTPGEMTYEKWEDGEVKTLVLVMALEDIPDTGEILENIKANSFMLFLNGSFKTVNFRIPSNNISSSWEVIIDTSYNTLKRKEIVATNKLYKVIDRSLVLLKPVQ